MIELVIIIIFSAIFLVYLWWKQRFLYWEKRNIPHLKPQSLLLGNNRDVFYGKLSLAENVQNIYNALAPHKYGGAFLFTKPVLYIRDPELIKRILIKDFHYFHDHNFNVPNKDDPLSLHLFFLSGKDWEILRRKLTPTFTSGKMKVMFDLMIECVAGLERIVEKCAVDREAANIKELMARYGTDVISSCAFGLEADALNDANSEFRRKGKEIFESSKKRKMYGLLLNTSPKLLRLLRVKRHPRNVKDFFVNLVNDTIKYRKENGVVRYDFLHLIMNIQDDETEEMKNFDFNLPAQCFMFFKAGFESSSNTLGFILFKLAENPSIQKKLQEEVDRVLGLNDEKITYDCLNEMPYMEKVFNETLRLYPAGSVFERICTEDYKFPDSDFVVKRGTTVFIPVQGLHRDPQYFPNADVFDPENFSEEAINSRPTCSFLPFGEGPRYCIGNRFALMQIRAALAMMMRKYTVTISPQMELPLKLSPNTLLTTAENEILLDFNKREE